VEEEGRRIKKRFTNYLDRLKEVQRESSWFPFPKLLMEFNKDFNFCVKSINWSHSQHFQMAENFRKAADLVETVEGKIASLEDRLKTLKIVRDSTLFVILMFRGFLWLGLASLLLSLLALPLLGFYGSSIGFGWAEHMSFRQQLELQGGMFVILAIISLALSAVRTALVFDKRKEKIFRQAEAQARKAADTRAAQRGRGGPPPRVPPATPKTPSRTAPKQAQKPPPQARAKRR
ncbi:MAG: tetratricopeptide repeat protein, partial [Desulfovibrio sp.]|nr:tetratricopeptide repeat protein [Desulfovibrio sp.]